MHLKKVEELHHAEDSKYRLAYENRKKGKTFHWTYFSTLFICSAV